MKLFLLIVLAIIFSMAIGSIALADGPDPIPGEPEGSNDEVDEGQLGQLGPGETRTPPTATPEETPAPPVETPAPPVETPTPEGTPEVTATPSVPEETPIATPTPEAPLVPLPVVIPATATPTPGHSEDNDNEDNQSAIVILDNAEVVPVVAEAPKFLPITGGDNSVVITFNPYIVAIDIVLLGVLLILLGVSWKVVVAIE